MIRKTLTFTGKRLFLLIISQDSGQLRQVPTEATEASPHTQRYNEFNHGTNYVAPNTVHARALYKWYLRDEIPLVGFARDVICGHIQQLWPAQKLFSVFVEVSGYQNGLVFIGYRPLWQDIHSSLRLEKRALGELQQSMLTTVHAKHRSKPCFTLYHLL